LLESLSPDGKTLAFSARDEHEKDFMRNREKYFLGTIPVRGGKINKLSIGYSLQPAFSPDGKKIAYVKGYYFKDGEKLRSTVNVWVMPATGGKSVQITDCPSGSRARGPVWSPDGQKIAFTHWLGGDDELWLMENFLPEEKK